jgi:hypothetical protein
MKKLIWIYKWEEYYIEWADEEKLDEFIEYISKSLNNDYAFMNGFPPMWFLTPDK